MSDTSQVFTDSELSIIKLKDALEQLADRTNGSSDTSTLLSEAMALFKSYFNNISDPEFSPVPLKTGDIVSSDVYNTNLKRIYSDISRFYKELNNLSIASIKSFNYSQVVIAEIKNRAQALASMVLDLSILNNFTRGDVIVGGDDFINSDYIDASAGLSSSPAEMISNGAGLSLARDETNNLTTNPRIKIEVLPISPSATATSSKVNTSPTPGNFNRFYEGNYYNFLGQARPEGGQFNIQFAADPQKINPVVEETTNNASTSPPVLTDKYQRGEGITSPGGKFTPIVTKPGVTLETDPPKEYVGVFLEYGASEDDKAKARLAMVDGNPDTFWECEYVVRLANPLVADVTDSMVVSAEVEGNPEDSGYSDPEAPDSASIQIDVNDLNQRALAQDVVDLTVDIIITLPEEQNVNFVSINPVVFSKNAFIDVVDISTISSTEGEFVTVDGWDTIKFPKTITPEANEFLTDSQVSASLAPNRYAYLGQGIYPFPMRLAKKVKVRLSMSQPASQVYERTYALLKNTLDIETTTTTTTTKGRFRF